MIPWLKVLLVLAKFIPWLNRWLNEYTAQKRLDSKDAAVDAAVDAIRLSAAKTEQQRASNSETRLSGGGEGGAGVDKRRVEDNKPTGV